MTFSDANINPDVLQTLRPHLAGPYCLASDGCKMVFQSNENLSDSYFDKIEYPVDKYLADRKSVV